MTGQLTGYVKKSNTQILNYTWILDFVKAQELKAWAMTNLTRSIKLTNWKGEVWSVKIISDQLILKAETAYQGGARQATSVSLQFEGVKING